MQAKEDEAQSLAELRAAAELVQAQFRRFLRLSRWRRYTSAKIPHIKGMCNMIAHPIHDAKMNRIGIEGPSGKQYRGESFTPFSLTDSRRVNLIFLVEANAFRWMTLIAILANCLLMAAQGPPGAPNPPLPPPTYELVQWAFTSFFTFELVTQALAMGFAGHDYSYISDPWNRLDLAIVTFSWLPLFIPSLDNVSWARALRALQPLRTIRRVPKLRRRSTCRRRSLRRWTISQQ